MGRDRHDAENQVATILRIVLGMIRQESERPYDRQLAQDADWTAIATVVIAIASLLSFGAAILQAWVFEGQLAEMRASSVQTDKLVTATANQADAAEIAAETARLSLIAASRAWVAPTDAKLNSAPVAGQDLGGAIVYQNMGREPARDGIHQIYTFAASQEEIATGAAVQTVSNNLTACLALPTHEFGEIVYPTTGFAAANVSFIVPKDNVDDELISGRKTLIVQGCFAYFTAEHVHHSGFCFYYNAPNSYPEHLNFCPSGNYAD